MIKKIQKYFCFKKWIINELLDISKASYGNPIEELLITRLKINKLIKQIKDEEFYERIKFHNKM